MTAVDFFCGAGGLTRGFLNAGISVVCGIDFRDEYRMTYEKNNKPSNFLSFDMRKLKTDHLKPYIQNIPQDKLLFAACAPCQPFTKQRRLIRNSREGTLLGRLSQFIKFFNPGVIFVENVPGITKIPSSSTYHRFLKLLATMEYSHISGVVDAKMYGVPQTRRRFILIAARKFSPSFPVYTHGSGYLPYRTVSDAIVDLPPIEAGEIHPNILNHKASMLSELNLRRIKNTPHDGGSRCSWTEELRLLCHSNGYIGHTDVYGRMRWNRPAPALTCRFDSFSNGRYGHPEQNRAISLREGARLQTFDDSYVFYGKSKSLIAAQIGNAVPVLLAETMGKHLLALWRNAEKNNK